MRQRGLGVCLFGVSILISACSMFAQNFEASGNGGFGVAERDGFGIPSVPSGGVTFGWQFSLANKLQVDYAFGHIERQNGTGITPSIHNRHFSTGSYVLQKPQGRYRPFVQIGAGVQYETNNDNQVINRDLYATSRTAFAGVVGAGLTVELGRGAFIRPQARTYIALGPTHNINVTALPCLGFGWRF
jgi:hypothetical protein